MSTSMSPEMLKVAMEAAKGKSATDFLGGLGPAIIGVSVTLCVIATIFIALRVFTYFFIVKNKGGWALFWAVIAWVGDSVTTAMQLSCIHGYLTVS